MSMDVDITFLDVGAIKPLWLQERAEIDIIVPPEARVVASTTVLHPHGRLDGATFETLISAAQAQIEAGASRIIVDLERVDAVSSAGIIGIYMVGALLSGEPLHGLEGYAVMNKMRDDIDQGRSFTSLLLAAPGDKIAQALTVSGLHHLVGILSSVDEAISAFSE
jgi:hypothetical protein